MTATVASPRSSRTGPAGPPRRPATPPHADADAPGGSQPLRRPRDKLGPFPTEFDVPQLKDRRAWWVARVFAVISIVSMMLNGVLAWAIVGLTPLKHVEPVLLTFANKSEQIVKIEPLMRGSKAADLAAEALAREYVIYRATVVRDENEQFRRWGNTGYIGRRTTAEEFNRFVNVARAAYEDMRQQGITREVITPVSVKIAEGYYTVDYETIDRDATEREVARLYWTASLTVEWLPQMVSFDDRYVNPLGFTVTNYSVAQRSTPTR